MTKSRRLNGVLLKVVLPLASFHCSIRWNTLKGMLSMLVLLWRLCFSHRQSNRLDMRHSCIFDHCWFCQTTLILAILVMASWKRTAIHHIARAARVEYGWESGLRRPLSEPMFEASYGRVIIRQILLQVFRHNKNQSQSKWQRFCTSDKWNDLSAYYHDESPCHHRYNRSVTVFTLNNQHKTLLDCTRDYNLRGLVRMITNLCNHTDSLILIIIEMNRKNDRRVIYIALALY